VDVESAISGIPGVVPIDGIEHAWKWAGGRRFTFTIALDARGGGAFQANAIDFYDEELVKALFEFARSNGAETSDIIGPQLVLAGFSHPGYSFDLAVLVRPEVHQYSTSQNEELIEVTSGLFPAYRCEFSGTETQEEARQRFARMLHPTNLKREPSPFLKMSFNNPRTGARSANDGRGYADFRVLENELTLLDGVPEAYVEMENFQQSIWRIRWNGVWLVEGSDILVLAARDEVVSWARTMVYLGSSDNG
jgi:hypothetical protein